MDDFGGDGGGAGSPPSWTAGQDSAPDGPGLLPAMLLFVGALLVLLYVL